MKINNYKVILIGIVIVAILLRVVFISKTNIANLQFDVGIKNQYNSEIDYECLYKNFDKDYNEGRHINYIMHLYTYGSLPDKIVGQFYHPPLHHFIMALELKIMDYFSDSASFKFESLQIITLIYSIIILITLYKILEELKIEDKYKIIPMLLFSCYPIYVFFAGSINNDELVTMFALLCLLFLIKWSKNPSMKNTIIIALCIGLGLMTKSSMYVMIVPSVYVYFKKLIEFTNEEKKVGKLLLELLLFTIIAGTLGFWFQIRSFMHGLFALGIIEPYEYLKIESKGFFARFGLTNFLKVSDCNIWNNLLYTSLNFDLVLRNSIYIKIMVLITLTLAIDEIYYIIKNFKKEKLLIVTFISWWLFYFFLNFQMPYYCSMHSRYMVVPLSIAIMILAKGLMEEKNKIIKIQVLISTITLCVLSLGMFLFMI